MEAHQGVVTGRRIEKKSPEDALKQKKRDYPEIPNYYYEVKWEKWNIKINFKCVSFIQCQMIGKVWLCDSFEGIYVPTCTYFATFKDTEKIEWFLSLTISLDRFTDFFWRNLMSKIGTENFKISLRFYHLNKY